MRLIGKYATALSIGMLISAAGSAVPALADESEGPLQDFPSLNMMMDPSGSETVSTFTVDAGRYATKDGRTLTITAAATYTCQGKTDNPHYSNGAGGVIAKTRVTCTGTSGNIPINVYSMLGRTSQNNISTLSVVATSQYTQNVAVNSGATTWYVPELGSGQKIARGAYFRGSHSGQGAPPLIPFNIGAAASAFVYVP